MIEAERYDLNPRQRMRVSLHAFSDRVLIALTRSLSDLTRLRR